MTKLQIISKLWSAIYDLIFLIKGTPTKSLEEIEADLDVIEYACWRRSKQILTLSSTHAGGMQIAMMMR